VQISLASAWRPRGELNRFLRLLSRLEQVYPVLSITLPPDVSPAVVQPLRSLQAVRLVGTKDWSWGRHLALFDALDSGLDHIHYIDFDRLLRWVETRPQEWLESVEKIRHVDCLIMGRTAAAYSTHPQALVKTEAISNAVVSHLVGLQVDVSAGSKGFSRAAAEHLRKYSRPGRALGTDGEWPVLLMRGGFQIHYTEVEGMDWESADRYQDRSAGITGQKLAAQAYDGDPASWAHRVSVAQEIIESAMDAAVRPLTEKS
jgi:hypothetical protein